MNIRKECMQLAEREYKTYVYAFPDKVSYRLWHIQKVAEIAGILYDILGEGNPVEKQAICIAAYLHDLKKFEDDETHAVRGANAVGGIIASAKREGAFSTLSEEQIQQISEMIRYHSQGYLVKHTLKIDEENEKRALGVRIIQDADKISKIYKKDYKIKLEAMLAHKSEAQRQIVINEFTKCGLNFRQSYMLFESYLDLTVTKSGNS